MNDPIDDPDLDLDEEPEAAPQPAPTPKPKPGKRRGAGAPPAAVGLSPNGGDAAKFVRQGSEADEVWNEIVQWLPSAGLSPNDVAIQARRVWPPSASGEGTPVGRAFGGEMVSGNQTEPPGSALVQFLIRYVHIPTTPNGAPASYDVIFMRKANGGRIAVGRVALPSSQECMQMLKASEQAGLGAPPQVPTAIPPMYQAPQPQFSPAGPPPQYPQGGQGYPQPYQPQGSFGPPPGFPMAPQGMGADVQMLMNELARTQGALNEALAAAREGRQPNIPGVAAPPAQGLTDTDVDRIAARVTTMLGARVAAPPPPPIPVPTVAAPPPADDGIEAMVRRTVSGMTERLISSALGSVEQNIKRGIGIGGVPHEDDAEETPAATVVPPENPEDMVPWKVGDVGANWSNGSPVKLATNKETGKIDPTGLLFANPMVAEKLMDVANGLGTALTDAIKNFGAKQIATAPPPAPAAQVVRQIPADAIDANPNGVGEIPPGWQAP